MAIYNRARNRFFHRPSGMFGVDRIAFHISVDQKLINPMGTLTVEARTGSAPFDMQVTCLRSRFSAAWASGVISSLVKDWGYAHHTGTSRCGNKRAGRVKMQLGYTTPCDHSRAKRWRVCAANARSDNQMHSCSDNTSRGGRPCDQDDPSSVILDGYRDI